MQLRNLLLDAWALLMPVECAGCELAGRAVCPACTEQLVPAPVPRGTPGGLRIVTGLRYEGVVRRVVLAYKEQQRTDVAGQLSDALAVAVRSADPGATAELALVPTSRAAYRRRGYDPVAMLVRRAGLRAVPVLRQARSTSRQKTLGIDERAANLRGALVAKRALDGRRFLLIDDVMTTGATIDEASRAVIAAGGEVIGGATLAFTPRLLPFRDIASGEDYGGRKGAQ